MDRHDITITKTPIGEPIGFFASTKLFTAITWDFVAGVKSTLESRADPNSRIASGKTPVHTAVTRGEKAAEILLLLMKYGGNIFVRDWSGESILHDLTRDAPVIAVADSCCTRRKFSEVYLAIALIWMGVPLDAKCSKGFQPIHLAASRENDNLLKLYLDLGANANALAEDGLTPLHVAARSQVPLTTLSVLLKRGANINQRTTDGRTALHEACINSQDDNIRILLSAGADWLAEDRDGKTPFALCVGRYGTESSSVRLMIKMLALRNDRLQASIELEDESLLKTSPKMWDYYRDCQAQIARMKLTRFADSCTFYELLTKSRDRIAGLMMGDSNFEANFGLYDLSGFCMYAEDILEAFEREQRRCRFLIEREDLINEAFYRTLPDVVTRKVVRHLWGFSEADEFRYFKY